MPIAASAQACDAAGMKAVGLYLVLAAREEAWRARIARTPVPASGCFEATYPLAVWKQVGCVGAPPRPYIPRANTVGDGHDYAAVTSRPTSAALGSFPVVKHLKSERGNGQPNAYSLQLNSNFMAGVKACAGAADPSQCRGWQQFAFSNGFGVAFMQYWLIDYGTACPIGWSAFQNSCVTNGNAISVKSQPIKQLKTLSLSGSAVSKGSDTLVLTTRRKAYSVTGPDRVLQLAKFWTGTEFNVVGDGGGTQAMFNAGTSLTVNIAVMDGTANAPICASDAGTTGETNNLNLGPCTAQGGTQPSVTFAESLPK
jgi:hypothetical protein